jgi:hypothetical protein
MMSEYVGPMGLANQQIRDAFDEFAAERLARRRLPALLHRTDGMLTELESLNLMRVRRAPASWRSDLTTLVADLPFEYEPRIKPHASPTAAIDLVFDIQPRLFRLMYGAESDDDLLEVAS